MKKGNNVEFEKGLRKLKRQKNLLKLILTLWGIGLTLYFSLS